MSGRKSSDKREEGEFVIPLAVGTIARQTKDCLPKKEGGHIWHEFVAYVRGDGISLGGLVDKVEFQLHKDLKNPTRVITKEPFEVTDRAWGEFDLTIKVTLSEKVFGERIPVATLMCHRLVLWKHAVSKHTVPGNGGNDPSFLHQPDANSNSLPTVYEVHDEIIVSNILKSANKRISAALKAPYVHPSGPRGWSIWLDIKNYLPPWMMNEDHQLERLSAILTSLEQEIQTKKQTLDDLSWRKGLLLQEASLIKRRKTDQLPV
eukprot:TRINITY_DN14084_c0_g1_i1.p1 TRINITY_DN14084_c0_g1~~TRINITY_DN14084_c0_g1_i1.p1  ORF type:complete len:262 (+),score=54.18 TRINITY_DN14084_c0_g1_i1:55-840(+)